MKILYLATSIRIDAELISKALTELGHQVTLVKEEKFTGNIRDYDCIFFSRLDNHSRIESLPIPKFFWYFDLINIPMDLDSSKKRYESVIQYLRICTHSFFTDGDAIKHWPDKTSRLLQGCHGLGQGKKQERIHNLLFAGTITKNRREFFKELKNKYRVVIHTGSPKYGDAYANLLAQAKIVIAPDSPIRHNYWSNRVYVVSGFGGFLLHPYIEELSHQYEDRKEIVYYRSREELYHLIDYYLDHPEEREAIMQNAIERTRKEHTYKHRCITLMETIQSYLP